jgi:transposase
MKIKYDAYAPTLSSALKDLLLSISGSRTMAKCLIQRADIVLLSEQKMTNRKISDKVGLHVNQVGKWRRRFLDQVERLNAVAQEKPADLEEELIRVLQDAPRAGVPAKFTADQRTLIVMIACQDPADHGFEVSNWSLPKLKAAILAADVVPEISEASINRILNENEVKPHKNRYWLHSTEKDEDPESYKAKIKAINETYQYASKISGTDEAEHHHVISTDEMTGIQALEHKHPDKLPKAGKLAAIEFEYIRHGTTSLIVFFDVVTGRMADPYLNATRTETDFVEALDAVINTDPDGEWTIVADNLNTHISASLVAYIARKIGFTGDLGEKGKNGILHNKESRIAFLTDMAHRIRFLYTPKHCSWMNQIEIWFGIINRQLLRRKSYTSVEDLKDSIRRFIDQYNRMFAHPFNWTYRTTPIGE